MTTHTYIEKTNHFTALLDFPNHRYLWKKALCIAKIYVTFTSIPARMRERVSTTEILVV